MNRRARPTERNYPGSAEIATGKVRPPTRQSVVRYLALLNGRTDGGQKQSLYGPQSLPKRTEKLLHDLCDFGAIELATKMLRRFEDVVRQRPAQRVDLAMKLQHFRACVSCLTDEFEYLNAPSPENHERMIRAMEKLSVTSQIRADAERAVQRRLEAR